MSQASSCTRNWFINLLVFFKDTYAQITLVNSNGQEIASNQTVVRRNQHHPIYVERYPFNIQENLLNQITVVVKI